MTWTEIRRAAIHQAALAVLADPTADPLDHEAAQKAIVAKYDWSRLTDRELTVCELLELRLSGARAEPLQLDQAPTPIVAHTARCTRCERFSDQDLAELRAVLAEDQDTEQVD